MKILFGTILVPRSYCFWTCIALAAMIFVGYLSIHFVANIAWHVPPQIILSSINVALDVKIKSCNVKCDGRDLNERCLFKNQEKKLKFMKYLFKNH